MKSYAANMLPRELTRVKWKQGRSLSQGRPQRKRMRTKYYEPYPAWQEILSSALQGQMWKASFRGAALVQRNIHRNITRRSQTLTLAVGARTVLRFKAA